MTTIWIQILSKMQEKLPEADYSVWIHPLKGSVIQKGDFMLLTIVARDSFVANFVKNKYADMFANVCDEVLGLLEQGSLPVRVVVEVDQNSKEKEIKNVSAAELARNLASAPALLATSKGAETITNGFGKNSHAQGVLKQLPLPIPYMKQSDFSFQFSFDEFIIGASNRLAFAAAESILQESSLTNMLFLSSQSGLGKTHLIQSVGKALCDKGKQEKLRIAYLSAEEFTSQFIRASQLRQMAEFKDSYRSLDVLLLEDVHLLQGKDKTQEELLATIKCLHASGGRVVLTSSFSPKEIAGIDSSLVSHFHTGFIASIEKPDRETRLHILMDKARKHSLCLPVEIADLMARRVTGDIRVLESCLNTLRLHSRMLNAPITEDMALRAISNVALDNPQLDLQSIIRLVCKAYGVKEDQLKSNSRTASLVQARNTAFYLLRKHTDMTLSQIGLGFNRRHSTVTKGIAQLEKEIARESSVGRQIVHTISKIECQCM